MEDSFSGKTKKPSVFRKKLILISNLIAATLKIWKKCTRLIESVEDKITHVSVLFSLETTNKKYEKAMKKINNAMPLLELEIPIS